MSRAKIILIACLFGLFASPAFAQCSGQAGSGLLCGNDGSATALPGWKTQTSILDRNFGGPSAQGTILNRGSSVWSATKDPVLGFPNTTTGSLGFAGSSGGTVTVKAQDTAGTWTFKWPTTGGSSGFVLTTDGVGNSTWTNPAAGGTVTSVGLALPSSILTVSGSPVTIAGTLTGSLATQTANTVWSGPTTGSAATPTFRSLVGADIPNPSASTLGGIQSYAGGSSQWIRSISTSGVPASSQPAFSDISGTLGPTQCPNPSASTIGCVQSLAAVTSKWINTISTSGVPSATQPNFTDIAGSVTLAQFPTIGSSTVLGNNSGGTTIPSPLTATQVLDFVGTTQGNVLYRNGTVWTALAPGTNGQVLTSGGAAANPAWATVSGTGTVTSIATNHGVTGGTVTTTGTIGLDAIANGTVLANVSGGSLYPSSTTPTLVLDVIGATQGQVLYRGASAWLALSPGTNGQVLQTQGAGATPQWANAGTVSSIATGTGLTGGTITTSGTIAFASVADKRMLANTSGGSAAPVATTATTWFDNAFCNTAGYIIARVAGVWTCAQSIPVQLAWMGVVSDGSTNNSTLINGIITTLLSATGGSLQFPPGTTCVQDGIVASGSPAISIGLIGTGGLSSVVSACGGNTAAVIRLNTGWSFIREIFINGKGIGDTAVFGANFPAIHFDTACVGCYAEHSYIVGGSNAIKIQAADVKLFRTYSASSYGNAVVYVGGATGVAGIRMEGTSFDQALPVTDAIGAGVTIATRANSTAYSTNQVVYYAGHKLQARIGGTSGGSTPTMKNYNQDIVDGSVTWLYAGEQNYNGLTIDSGASEVYLSGLADMSGAALNYAVAIRNDGAQGAPFLISLRDTILGGNLQGSISAVSGSDLYIDGGEALGCLLASCDQISIGAAWGASTTIRGMRISNAQRAGLAVSGGTQLIVTGNQIKSNGVFGVILDANVSDFAIQTNAFAANGSTAVTVSAGASDYYSVINNNMHGATVVDGGSGTHKAVSPNY